MIAFIQGELCEIGINAVTVACQGMGFEIQVPTSVLGMLPDIGMPVKIYTYMYVREDVIGLYGFMTKADLDLFKLLITVNGVGPKGALSMLSSMGGDEIQMAILAEDAKTLSKAQGIGAKTAQRMILDLKEKINIEEMVTVGFERESTRKASERTGSKGQAGAAAREDAVMALVALGYSSTEAMKAVRAVTQSENMDSETLLKQALKHMLV